MMGFWDWLATTYNSNLLLNGIIVPFALCAITYFIFGRKDEFDDNGIHNIAATLVLGGFNFVVALTFYHDVNQFMQASYDRLHIPTLDPSFWDQFPFWAVMLFGVVAKDFADYWNHRLMHTAWLWPTHAAHHSDTHVNAFTAFRVHFLEGFVMIASYIILLTWLQIPSAIPVVVMLGALHNHYVHMNLPYTHGPLRYLVASPAFHRWHHADEPEAYGKNLANLMPIWDKLFGTYYYPGPCTAPMGALKTGVEDKNPVLIFLYPALEWSRMIRSALGRSKPEDPNAVDDVSSGVENT